ncbi:MAG: hypothetical protein KAX23_05010 [Dehalococcoidia bacterium]|jgi:hypothetical protein|nr:hypothetical protein [Chloroflexota bacterium]MCK4242888.1 hypothetical protein [Dehalococcoidia bacterium]
MKIKVKDLKPGMTVKLSRLLGGGAAKLYDLPQCPASECPERIRCWKHDYVNINWVKGMELRFHGEDAELERIV